MKCSTCGATLADGMAFCAACGVRQAEIATASADTFCGRCGMLLPNGVSFCPSCGASATTSGESARTEQTPPRPPTAPMPVPPNTAVAQPDLNAPPKAGPKKKVWALVGGGITAIVAVIVTALLIAGSGGDTTDSASTNDGPSNSTVVTTVTTVVPTTIDPITAARNARPQLYDLAVRLENILEQSSAGRGQVGQVVGNVRSCSVTPNTAAFEIDQVVTNRQLVLGQIVGLTNNAGPEGTALINSLQSAIQNSIDADIYYAMWMRYLYSRYYYTYPIGCPSGSAPTNSDYDMAVTYSGRASTAKQQFVDQFNPIAEALGLATWDPGNI